MKSNILVVDDEPVARQSLTDILKLEGFFEWDAVVENYGVGMVKTIRGTFTNTIKITQEGSLFKGIRLEPEGKRAKGSMFMQGELDKNGFKTVYYIDLAARLLPCTGEISKGGSTIMIDEGFFVRAKLTRK